MKKETAPMTDELWDEFSQHLDSDIDTLQVFSGRSVMTKEDFIKAINKLSKDTEQTVNYRKAYHSYQLDVNRITKSATKYKTACQSWKTMFKELNAFIKVLLADGRITKEELFAYSPKRKTLK